MKIASFLALGTCALALPTGEEVSLILSCLEGIYLVDETGLTWNS